MRIFSIIISLSLIMGCASTYHTPAESVEELAVDLEENGYLLGSISFFGEWPEGTTRPIGAKDNCRYQSYSFLFKSKSDDKYIGDISPIPSKTVSHYKEGEGDYEIEEGLGYYFVMPVPAGKYTFYNYRLSTYPVTFYSKDDLELDFQIEAGKIHYLGDVRIEHLFAKNFLGMTTFGGGRFEVLNSKDLHMKSILEKYEIDEGLEIVQILLHPVDADSAANK